MKGGPGRDHGDEPRRDIHIPQGAGDPNAMIPKDGVMVPLHAIMGTEDLIDDSLFSQLPSLPNDPIVPSKEQIENGPHAVALPPKDDEYKRMVFFSALSDMMLGEREVENPLEDPFAIGLGTLLFRAIDEGYVNDVVGAFLAAGDKVRETEPGSIQSRALVFGSNLYPVTAFLSQHERFVDICSVILQIR